MLFICFAGSTFCCFCWNGSHHCFVYIHLTLRAQVFVLPYCSTKTSSHFCCFVRLRCYFFNYVPTACHFNSSKIIRCHSLFLFLYCCLIHFIMLYYNLFGTILKIWNGLCRPFTSSPTSTLSSADHFIVILYVSIR